MGHGLRTAVLLFGICIGVWSSPAQASGVQTISAARRAKLGSTVTVRGVVTVPTGAFDAGFALQQALAGIYVIDSAGKDLAIDDVVVVTGKLVSNNGLLALEPQSIERLRKGRHIRPKPVQTSAVGESTEGRLLHLEGTVVGPLVDDSPYGYKLTLDDGSGPILVFLYPGAAVDRSDLEDGVPISVDCFSSQYDTHYECDPPSADSLHIED